MIVMGFLAKQKKLGRFRGHSYHPSQFIRMPNWHNSPCSDPLHVRWVSKNTMFFRRIWIDMFNEEVRLWFSFSQRHLMSDRD